MLTQHEYIGGVDSATLALYQAGLGWNIFAPQQ